VRDDDDDSDTYMPDAKPDEVEDDDSESLVAEESSPSATSAGTSPESVVRKPKSNLSRFNASSPPSSSPSTPSYSVAKSAVGAFGKPKDKGERAKKFTETNKDRYSWLTDIRDKDGNRPGEENYDPRTLYIPSSAWKSFTAFERQYWYFGV
jgi:DNA mismatch repair protein MSH6